MASSAPSSADPIGVESAMTVPGQIFQGTHFVMDHKKTNEVGISSKITNPILIEGTDNNTEKRIICVHGIGGCHSQFRNIAAALKDEGYVVVRYDLLGRGYSEFPADIIFDDNAHVKQLRDLIIHLGWNSGPKYNIIAHSMGGAIATLYSNKFHDEINSIALLAPAGLLDPGVIRVVRGCFGWFQNIAKSVLSGSQEKAWRQDYMLSDEKARELQEEAIEDLRRASTRAPTIFEALWQSVLQFPLYGLDADVATLASLEHVPLYIAWGDEDKAVPFYPNFDRWRRIVDEKRITFRSYNVKYATYTGLGHGFFIESPDIVNGSLLSFYSDIVYLDVTSNDETDKDFVRKVSNVK